MTSEKKVKVEESRDLTTQVINEVKKASSRLLGKKQGRDIPLDLLTYHIYKFVTIYDAARLASTQHVLKDSMVIFAKGGRLELNGRSREAIARDCQAFLTAIAPSLPSYKSMVLREADTYMGRLATTWRGLLSQRLAKLEELDITAIGPLEDGVLDELPQHNMRRFRLHQLCPLYRLSTYGYFRWFGSLDAWIKLEDWDAPAVQFGDPATLQAILGPSAKTLRRLVLSVSSVYSEELQRDLATMFPKLVRLRLLHRAYAEGNLKVPALPTLERLQLEGSVPSSLFDDLAPLSQLRKLGYTDVSRNPQVLPLDVLGRLESLAAPGLVSAGIEAFLKRATEAKCVRLRHVVDTILPTAQSVTDVDRICADFPQLETLGQSIWDAATRCTPDKVYEQWTWIRLVQDGAACQWPRCPNLRMLNCDMRLHVLDKRLPYPMLETLDL